LAGTQLPWKVAGTTPATAAAPMEFAASALFDPLL